MKNNISLKYPKTTEGLRDLLFDEIENLRLGKIDPAQARVTANLAKQIIESIRIQVQFQRVLSEQKKTMNLVGDGRS